MLGLDSKLIRLRIYLTQGCIYAWVRYYNDKIENIYNQGQKFVNDTIDRKFNSHKLIDNKKTKIDGADDDDDFEDIPETKDDDFEEEEDDGENMKKGEEDDKKNSEVNKRRIKKQLLKKSRSNNDNDPRNNINEIEETEEMVLEEIESDLLL